ncbi:NS2 [Letea virus]|nr:NS2 [Letea virus]
MSTSNTDTSSPLRKIIYTKTLVILDRSGSTFCGKIARLENKQYCVVKIGRSVQISASDVPPPKSYILDITQAGAYKISDNQNVIMTMIDTDSIEVCLDRWDEWCFESINAIAYPSMINIDGQMIDTELKICKGAGLVPPYTSLDFNRRDVPELPGVQTLDVRMSDHRAKLKDQRDLLRQKMDTAMDSKMSKSTQRLFGAQMHKPLASTSRDKDIVFQKVKNSTDVEIEMMWDENPAEYITDVVPSMSTIESEQLVDGADDWGDYVDEEPEKPILNEGAPVTVEYQREMEKVMNAPPRRAAGMCFGYPSESGQYDTVLFEGLKVWNDVPLFVIDPELKKYSFLRVGSSARVLGVKAGGVALLLPAGSGP